MLCCLEKVAVISKIFNNLDEDGHTILKLIGRRQKLSQRSLCENIKELLQSHSPSKNDY